MIPSTPTFHTVLRIALASAAAALVARAPVAAAAPVTTASKIDGVTVDWTRGAVVARGVGPADRHAPSPAVARVGARRAAEDQARARLADAVKALPVAGGGTVGSKATGEAAARLERELALAPVVAVELGTDGSARVELALGLEAVRQALDGPRAVTGAVEPEPATVVVDARATKLAPAIGVDVTAGGQTWRGPIVFARSAADVPRGPGARTIAKAKAARGGSLTIDGSAPSAGALVVVLLPEKP